MKHPPVFNYVVGFYDLLGQRNALRGQGLLRPFTSEAAEQEFVASVKGSIGAIVNLQRRAEELLVVALRHRRDSPLRMALPKKQRPIWDAMHRVRISTQRWSDGLVNFICLGDTTIQCPTSAVFTLLGIAGSLCYMGLAARRPIRGAIDIAWGVELHKGELYGAAVARTYELESEVAKYPRIVIGGEAIQYIQYQRQNPGTDYISTTNKAFADLSFSLLVQDFDGAWIIDYLGAAFRDAVATATQREMYPEAQAFVDEQIQLHTKSGDEKLTERYRWLSNYFNASPLATVAQQAAAADSPRPASPSAVCR